MADPVVIVGSGPAGVSAAWPLLQAGIPVLMIDAATPAVLPPSPAGDIATFRRDPARWQTQFGADLGGLRGDPGQSPKLATPLARAVLAGYAARIGFDTTDFVAFGGLVAGGLSNIWGAAAPIYDDADLRGFPFPRADLLPSYDAVAQRIGLSRPGVGAGPALAPPLRRLWQRAQRQPQSPGFDLEPASNAVLAEDRPGRAACVSCNLCLWGCRRGSIYNSAQELPALRAFPHFTYQPGLLVRRLLPQDGRPAVETEADGTSRIVAGRLVLLACGTIGTTALVLRHLGPGAGPLRLLTNPAAAMAFLVPSLLGADLPANGFALGQLAYRATLEGGSHAAGMLYAADALPLATVAHRLPLARPTALRFSRTLAPALVLATCYLPGQHSANRLELAGDDARLRLAGSVTPDAAATFRAAATALRRRLSRLGAIALPGSFARTEPGADAHYAGTLPMGGAGPTGTDLSGAIAGLPGFHAVDGAVLPVLPARHCTLTIMANADRIARRLAA